MQSVSAAYKSGMKSPLRNRGYISVEFGIFNDTLQSQAEFSHPADTYAFYSNDTRVFSDGSDDFVYATLENNFFKADGSQRFLPPQNSRIPLQNSGVVSQELVDDGNVIFTINFPQTTWYGLTIDFGENYPVDFDIIYGNQTYQVRGNDNSEYVADLSFTNISQIKLKFWEMRESGNRARIYSIQFGIGYTFGNDDIMDSTFHQSVSPISEYIPQYDFMVVLKNYDHYFDVDNPNSVINFFSADNKVSVKYGLELDDGTIEWVNGYKLLCNEWESDDQTATIRCVDILRRLDMDYAGTAFYASGTSYGELAEILAYDIAGLETCEIPESMYERTTTLPLPHGTVRELLQMVANACECVLMLDREGNLAFKEISTTVTPGFRMEQTDMLSYPKAIRNEPVKEVVVSYQRWRQLIVDEQCVASDTITVESGTYRTFYFSEPFFGLRATVNGSSYSIANFGDYYVTLYFASGGEKAVEVFGKPYAVTQQQFHYEVSGVSEGRTVYWDNPLIDNRYDAVLLAVWLSRYYNSDIEYDYDTRGNPEIDACDVIYQDNRYNQNLRVMVTDQTLAFKQSFKGHMVTRKIGGSS